MTTPKKKDRSMLYAVLIGFVLFVLVPVLLIGSFLYVSSQTPPFFPEGTEFETIDNIGGFPAVGAETTIAHIPSEHAEEFEEKLRESGYVPTPIASYVYGIDRYDDLSGLYSIENGLWCIYDDTPESRTEKWENFTFHIYDLDTCTYYKVHVLT